MLRLSTLPPDRSAAAPNKPLKLRLRYEKVDGFHPSSYLSVRSNKGGGERGAFFLLSVCLLMTKLQQRPRGRERRRQSKAVICGKELRGARQRLTLQKSGKIYVDKKYCAELLPLLDHQQDLLLVLQLREGSSPGLVLFSLLGHGGRFPLKGN